MAIPNTQSIVLSQRELAGANMPFDFALRPILSLTAFIPRTTRGANARPTVGQRSLTPASLLRARNRKRHRSSGP